MILALEAVCFDLFGTLVTDGGDPIPGARDALLTLGDAPWCIVTSCGGAFARSLIARAGLAEPRILIAAEHVLHGKPAADPYVLASETLRIAPSRALVVEDSRQGIAAGRAAGMDVMAILNGRGLAFARDASYQVERFADLQWAVEEDGTIRVSF